METKNEKKAVAKTETTSPATSAPKGIWANDPASYELAAVDAGPKKVTAQDIMDMVHEIVKSEKEPPMSLLESLLKPGAKDQQQAYSDLKSGALSTKKAMIDSLKKTMVAYMDSYKNEVVINSNANLAGQFTSLCDGLYQVSDGAILNLLKGYNKMKDEIKTIAGLDHKQQLEAIKRAYERCTKREASVDQNMELIINSIRDYLKGIARQVGDQSLDRSM